MHLGTLFGLKSPLLVPLTPFERRMAELSARVLPTSSTAAEALKRQVRARMEYDLAFRKYWRDKFRKVRHWAYMRTLSGSGLLMAKTLRDDFGQCLWRLMYHGPHSMPISFNVVESFLKYDTEKSVFDMRPEREHLLSADDYFDWYKSSDFPKDPDLLMTAMVEGVVYAYNMSGDSDGSRLSGCDSTLVVAGVSLVRHQYELSCMLVGGERPPNPPDDDIPGLDLGTAPRGKEKLVPDPALRVEDRYLDHLPGFARVILLARLDLRAKKYYVRYVFLDNGNHCSILTDDADAVRCGMSDDQFRKWKKTAEEKLRPYDVLFSALTSLIFLPVAFVAEIKQVTEVEFKTECFAKQSERAVKDAVIELGTGCCVNSTEIRCLAHGAARGLEDETEIKPPEMAFQSEGYWRTLLPGEIGQDKNGTAIVGRSWVTRTETWSASKPQAFLVRRPAPVVTGPDPGIVYVMRSDAHGLEIYKIGLTRRTSEERSRELSSATGVPLPFGILAQWEVGDCAAIESEIHQRLDAHRINERREFFRLPLRTIVAVVNSVVEASAGRRANQMLRT